MLYATQHIWRGIYSSHQRCTEAIKRLTLEVDQQGNISRKAYVEVLQYRLKTAKGETRETALMRLEELGAKHDYSTLSPSSVENALTASTLSEAVPVEKPAIIEAIESLAHWTTSRAAIFLTLLGALSIQIHHLASLVHRVTENDGLLLGYVFATVSELTALMLTVHQARRGMLIAFAFVQCWINVLYYCTLPDLVIRLTLSALIAFVIYSYSELFTAVQREAAVTTASTKAR